MYLLLVVNSISLSIVGKFLLDFLVALPVILSAILLPIKSPVASADFCIALFDAVFNASVADF